MLCRAAVIVFLAIPLMTACGIITAPVTVPNAIARNVDFHVNATVVDPAGKPLDNVILSQELHHYFWSPTAASGTVTDERSSRLINGPFTVNERGALLKLHFSRDGFFDQTCIINAGTPTRITTDELINGLREGPRSWVLSPDLHIVMIPRTPDAGLLHAGANCFYSDYPRMWAVTLPPVARLPGATSSSIPIIPSPSRPTPSTSLLRRPNPSRPMPTAMWMCSTSTSPIR
jgi:hypothetical protein